MMKRKELLKRSLAAVLSATLAFTLAPNVSLFSVPTQVRAAIADDSITGITGPDAGSSNGPSIGGAYLDTNEADNYKVVMGSTDSEGIDLLLAYTTSDDVEKKADRVDVVLTKKGTDSIESLASSVKNEISFSYDVTKKILNIKTNGATKGGNYTLKVTPKYGETGTALDTKAVYIKVYIGYRVTYDYAMSDPKDVVSPAASNKTSVLVKLPTDGKISVIAKDDDEYSCKDGNHAYAEFSYGENKTVEVGKKIYAEDDITLKPVWKKLVIADAKTVSKNDLVKEYDGTTNWSAEVVGTAAANEEGKREVPVTLSGELSSSAVGKNINTTATGVVSEGVSDADDYIVKVDNASLTGIEITKVKLNAEDIVLTNASFEKMYNNTEFTNTELTGALTGIKVIHDGKTIAGACDVATGGVKYDDVSLSADDQKKIGKYSLTLTLAAPTDSTNYEWADKANIIKVDAEIKKAESYVELTPYTFNVNDDNLNGSTSTTVNINALTKTDAVMKALRTGDKVLNGTGSTLANSLEVSYDEPTDSQYFAVDPVKTTEALSGSGNDTFEFTLKSKTALADYKITGKKVIGINLRAADEAGNYDVCGHIKVTLTSADAAYIGFNSSLETYGKGMTDTYAISSGYSGNPTTPDPAKSIKTTVAPFTTITYTDATGKVDMTDDFKAGVVDVTDATNYIAKIVVDGGNYYGEAVVPITATEGTLTKDSFVLDTEAIYYNGEDTIEPIATLSDPDGIGYVLDPSGEVKPTLTYSLDGVKYVEFDELIKTAPVEDTEVRVKVATEATANYNACVGVVLDDPIIYTAKEDTRAEEAAAKEAAEKFIEAAGSLPQTKEEVKDTAATETAIKDAEALKLTDEQMALLDDETRAKVEEAAGKIDTAKSALEEAKKSSEGTTKTFTVTFNTEGGSEVAAKSVKEGEAVAKPETNPTKEGYTFAGWYLGDEEYDFTKAVTEDITLTAKWTKNEQSEGSGSGTDTTTGSSTDVTPSGSGSGGSGGGGGSSNAKTVKNADGSTTTTTTTAKGTIETTTKTNADGSKTTSKVVKNKDGSGSVTETSVSAAGTTKVVEVVTDTTGAATEVTTTVSNSKGASMKVTYAAKGTAITVSKVETTGKTAVSIPATVKVGGKTYKVTKIAASALKGNKEITKVTLGKNVKSIGKNAFNGDSKLKTIVMKKAPTTVGKNAFKGIAKKATIKIKATKKAFKTAKKLIKKSGVASTVKIKRTK